MRARYGFTLVEVLVTLILIGVLIGVVLPAVVNQMDRGDTTRVAQDLEAIRSGARMFRVDVRRYPATLEQLTEAPGASAASWDSIRDLGGSTIADGLLQRWNGPYLEGVGIVDVETTLPTALGGEIQPLFTDTADLAGVPYLTVQVNGLQNTDIIAISEIVDGNAVVLADSSGGRVRMTGTDPWVLHYLAIPIN